jgi:hypothetical protein
MELREVLLLPDRLLSGTDADRVAEVPDREKIGHQPPLELP